MRHTDQKSAEQQCDCGAEEKKSAKGGHLADASSEKAPAVAIDALRLGFLGWALGAVLSGDLGEAAGLVVTFGVVLLPRFMRLPTLFDLAWTLAWLLQSLGKFAGLWQRVECWDTLVHFVLPMASSPSVALLLARRGFFGERFREPPAVRWALGVALLGWLLAIGFGTLYELYEWQADKLLGTHYQPSNDDTMTDIAANTLGGLTGALLLLLWASRARSP